MAGKTVSFSTRCNLCNTTNLESLAKWLSCNGEVWGVGPTAVFASAAALFLYNELEATVLIAGNPRISLLEKTLISTMVLGMLALMVHLWVCSMRFFQYYLDTLIRDSPSMLLEMTTVGLLGGQAEMVALGPLTKFLRQQQPQIHITVCWFLSLCYADYVRKHYCQRFNIPYLEQWQAELHERAKRGVNSTMQRVHSFVGSVHQRLHVFGPQDTSGQPNCTSDAHTVEGAAGRRPRLRSVGSTARSLVASADVPPRHRSPSSASQASRLLTLLRNSDPLSLQRDVYVAVHRTPGWAVLPRSHPRKYCDKDLPWRSMAKLSLHELDHL